MPVDILCELEPGISVVCLCICCMSVVCLCAFCMVVYELYVCIFLVVNMLKVFMCALSYILHKCQRTELVS